MPLKESLDAIVASRGPVWHEIYRDFVDTLTRGDTIGGVLPVGAPMPAFELANAEGRLIDSDTLLAAGPLVVTFFRGDWCPWCNLMFRALEAALPRIRGAGGTLVALTPEMGGRNLALKRERGLSYEILYDMDSGVALDFGVLFRIPERYRASVEAAGWGLAARHGNGGWSLPIPACFVVDRAGIIRARFADVDYTHRPEPDAIVAALWALRD
jgi:peroxiredoxin